MWNKNSQRWLVTDQVTTSLRNDPNETQTTISADAAYIQQPRSKCRTRHRTGQTRSHTPACAKTRTRTKTRMKKKKTTKSIASTQTSASRVKPCLYQIIEVLLAILLANCLTLTVEHLPGTEGAFGAPAEDMDEEALRPNPAMSNSHYNYRHPYSIASSNGVYDFNSLQRYQPQSDYQTANHLHRSQNYKISPKPCSIGHVDGTCMFVWECIKSEGRHVGMCVDSFMFGSCCAHNYTDNIIQQQTFSYTRPTKPVGMGSLNHKPRPPHEPYRPSISGMTTIERPHGAGTLVIRRPSGPQHQGVLHKPHYPRPTAATSTSSSPDPTESHSLAWSAHTLPSDMVPAASIAASSANIWNSSPHHASTAQAVQQQQQHWHISTEPNFITKPRPPSWDKPTPLRPKPPKPTKKPIVFERPTLQQTPPSIVYSSTQPTTRPYTQATPSWNEIHTSSTSVGTTQHSTTTSTTTTQKYRPSSTTTLATSSSVPPKTTYRPQPQSQPTTQHSSTTSHYSSPPASTRPTSTPLSSSSTTSHSFSRLPPNITTIESNEIIDTADSGTSIVKTISAARSECGVPVLARPETRIVGGKSAAFGRWPWQVSVRRTSFFGFSSTHRCGGALINENWIATAGHCVDDLLIAQIRIRVGEYDFSHVQEQLPYIERGVSKKVVHPKYNFFTYEYDLALVKLEQPLEFAAHVSPICLPQTDSLLIGMNATVTGWGRLSEGGTLPSVLQEVSVPIVSNDNCKSMFLRAGRQEFIPEIFLCAGFEGGGQDSCQGDSGGPLQVKAQDGRFFLAGIISWGIGCAEANLPGVCTRISKFVPWIMENVT